MTRTNKKKSKGKQRLYPTTSHPISLGTKVNVTAIKRSPTPHLSQHSSKGKNQEQEKIDLMSPDSSICNLYPPSMYLYPPYMYSVYLFFSLINE